MDEKDLIKITDNLILHVELNTRKQLANEITLAELAERISITQMKVIRMIMELIEND